MSVDPHQPITPETRERLLHVSRETQRYSEFILQALVQLRRRGAGRMAGEFRETLNANELVLLLNFDVSVLMEDLLSANSDLRASLYARTLLLTVYESTKVLRNLLDHRFRASVATLLASPELEQELRDSHSMISRLFQRCERDFADVRNGLLGHKDRDAETRIQLLEKTDAELVVQLTADLLEAIAPVVKTCFYLVQHQSRSFSAIGGDPSMAPDP